MRRHALSVLHVCAGILSAAILMAMVGGLLVLALVCAIAELAIRAPYEGWRRGRAMWRRRRSGAVVPQRSRGHAGSRDALHIVGPLPHLRPSFEWDQDRPTSSYADDIASALIDDTDADTVIH